MQTIDRHSKLLFYFRYKYKTKTMANRVTLDNVLQEINDDAEWYESDDDLVSEEHEGDMESFNYPPSDDPLERVEQQAPEEDLCEIPAASQSNLVPSSTTPNPTTDLLQSMIVLNLSIVLNPLCLHQYLLVFNRFQALQSAVRQIVTLLTSSCKSGMTTPSSILQSRRICMPCRRGRPPGWIQMMRKSNHFWVYTWQWGL